jgi:hypothetical protein
MENLNNIKEFLIELNNSIDSKTREELQAETNSIHSIINEYLPESKWYLGDLVKIRGTLEMLVKMKNDVGNMGITLENQKLALINFLNPLIKQIDKIGLPAKKIENGPIFNISQNQTQEQLQQQQQINYITELIKDEFYGKQLKELDEIINNSGEKSNSKKRIIDKLGGFGGNVCENIVANLITNPNIWQNII